MKWSLCGTVPQRFSWEPRATVLLLTCGAWEPFLLKWWVTIMFVCVRVCVSAYIYSFVFLKFFFSLTSVLFFLHPFVFIFLNFIWRTIHLEHRKPLTWQSSVMASSLLTRCSSPPRLCFPATQRLTSCSASFARLAPRESRSGRGWRSSQITRAPFLGGRLMPMPPSLSSSQDWIALAAPCCWWVHLVDHRVLGWMYLYIWFSCKNIHNGRKALRSLNWAVFVENLHADILSRFLTDLSYLQKAPYLMNAFLCFSSCECNTGNSWMKSEFENW